MDEIFAFNLDLTNKTAEYFPETSVSPTQPVTHNSDVHAWWRVGENEGVRTDNRNFFSPSTTTPPRMFGVLGHQHNEGEEAESAETIHSKEVFTSSAQWLLECVTPAQWEPFVEPTALELNRAHNNSSICIRFLQIKQGYALVTDKQVTRLRLMHLTNEIQRRCWPQNAAFDMSEIHFTLYDNHEGRREGKITLRQRSTAKLAEDQLVGALLAFIIGNGITVGQGQHLKWCPLVQVWGTTTCGIVSISAKQEAGQWERRMLTFGHQRKGDKIWHLSNHKDGVLRRMVAVLYNRDRTDSLLSLLAKPPWKRRKGGAGKKAIAERCVEEERGWGVTLWGNEEYNGPPQVAPHTSISLFPRGESSAPGMESHRAHSGGAAFGTQWH